MPALRDPKEGRLDVFLPALTAKQIRDAERDQVYIYNTSNRSYSVQGPNRFYLIPACPAGHEVSEPLIIPGAVYTTAVKKVSGLVTDFDRFQIDGIDVAMDIIGTAPFKHESANLTRWGVFIAENAIPTALEIATARQHWMARCEEKVREGNSFFAINAGMVNVGDGRLVSNISPDHLEAAQILGVEPAWSKKTVDASNCPFCGVSVQPGLAFCPNGDVLDEEKARVARPWLFAQAESVDAAPRRGRPPLKRKEAA